MGHQPSQRYLTAAITAPGTYSGGSLWLGADCVTGFSITVKTTGAAAGAFRFYMSDDQRARQDASTANQLLAVWNEFTADVAAQIVNPGGAVQFNVLVSDFRAGFLKMDFVSTGSAGTVESWYSGVGGG